MNVVIGQYLPGDSWVHRLDPRTKLISLILLIVSTFLINNVETMIIAFALVLVLIRTSSVPIRTFMRSILPLMFLLIFTIIFQILMNDTGELVYSLNTYVSWANLLMVVGAILIYHFLKKKVKFRFLLFLGLIAGIVFIMTLQLVPEWRIWTIEVYSGGLRFATFLIVRILILVSLSSLLTLTTKPTHLNGGLEEVMKPLKKFKVPTEEISMMISIALRFIPTLLDEANKIMKAQASRGVDFQEGNLKQKVTQIISLLIPMFIISFKRADDLANAMEARGYSPGKPRTKLVSFRYQPIDYVVLSICILVIPGVIILGI